MGCATCIQLSIQLTNLWCKDDIMFGCRHLEWRIKIHTVQTTIKRDMEILHNRFIWCAASQNRKLSRLIVLFKIRFYALRSMKYTYRIIYTKVMIQNHWLLIVEWKSIITLMNMHSFNFDNNSNKELPWDNCLWVWVHWQSVKIHPFMRSLIQNRTKIKTRERRMERHS